MSADVSDALLGCLFRRRLLLSWKLKHLVRDRCRRGTPAIRPWVITTLALRPTAAGPKHSVPGGIGVSKTSSDRRTSRVRRLSHPATPLFASSRAITGRRRAPCLWDWDFFGWAPFGSATVVVC